MVEEFSGSRQRDLRSDFSRFAVAMRFLDIVAGTAEAAFATNEKRRRLIGFPFPPRTQLNDTLIEFYAAQWQENL
ncbi:MAG: hypothetical protein ACE5JO_09340 [Candidatus Binatia bacterium]